MKDIETLANEALEYTEANALVVGTTETNNMFWCQPLWECENEVDAQKAAFQMAVSWADKNGCCDIRTCWAYRKLES